VSAEASTEEGEVIRDGAASIDHYEQRCGNEHTPNSQNRRSTKKLDATTTEKPDYKVSIFLPREHE
jgi:hypothetical protein